MFGKKLLNLVGLLFVGHQIKSAFANASSLTYCTDIEGYDSTDCAGTTSEANADNKLCLGDNKKIYKLLSNGSGCFNKGDALTDDGIIVYSDSATGAIVVGSDTVLLNGDESPDSGIVNGLKVYKCSGSGTNCVQTFGYVKIDDYYCTVGANGTNSCVASSTITTDCGSASDGVLCDSTGVNLRLEDDKYVAQSATGNYVITNPDNDVFTTSSNTNKAMVIEVSTNAFTLNPLGESVNIYTLNSSTNKLSDIDLDSEIESGSTELSIYVCNSDNLCTATTEGYVFTGTNFYTVSGGVATLKTEGFSDSCSGSGDIGNIARAGESGSYTYSICLDGTATATTSSPSYIIKNRGTSEFTVTDNSSDGINKFVVIQASSNAYVLNTNIDDDEYCIDASSQIFMERCDNFCSANDCDKYYSCQGNLCHDIRAVPASGCDLATGSGCTAGYYLAVSEADKTLQTNVGTAGILYKCNASNTACGKVGTTGFDEAEGVKIGYYQFNGRASELTSQYIVCSSTMSGISCSSLTGSADCTTAGVGGIKKSGNNYSICLSTTKEVQISNDNAGKYFVNVGANDQSTFGYIDPTTVSSKQYHVIVNLTSNTVLVEAKAGATPDRYKYTSVLQKITDKASNSEICAVGKVIQEYKYVDNDTTNTNYDYYVFIQEKDRN